MDQVVIVAILIFHFRVLRLSFFCGHLIFVVVFIFKVIFIFGVNIIFRVIFIIYFISFFLVVGHCPVVDGGSLSPEWGVNLLVTVSDSPWGWWVTVLVVVCDCPRNSG